MSLSASTKPVAASPGADDWIDGANLVERLLAEQRSLPTAVEEYAHWHDTSPALAFHYRKLIPAAAPGAGEQYAFKVNVSACSGCKACVSACHSLNGLDEDEAWRDVGWIIGSSAAGPVQQTITTACHHCLEPGCLEGCPVLAYEKDPVTGIVRHLDDQCIGCQYCVLKCPYDVPKYSHARGIVRKCDMCTQRLASGEAPACVQACPNEAIQIVLTSREEVERRNSVEDRLVPGAPRSSITNPTTSYHGVVDGLDMRAADGDVTRLEPAHWPLVWMLVLTQMSAGALTAWVLDWTKPAALLVLALVSGIAGVGASVFHLGQPMKAWRVFLGLRTSWLSREVMGFGLYLPLMILAFACATLEGVPPSLAALSGGVAAVVGWGCVLCSIMVYVSTKRPFWNLRRTAFRFAATAVMLGFFAALAVTREAGWAILAAYVASLKWIWEMWFLLRNAKPRNPLLRTTEERSAAVLLGPLRGQVFLRWALLAGGFLLWNHLYTGLFLLAASELVERSHFFKAGGGDRMPGHPGGMHHG
jgi:formate dehydrogenase iron-sulfur subunit